jgi:hypothetical protein
MTDNEILQRLNKSTYVVEHNPNCPSPYLVRLPGRQGFIDKLFGKSGDISAYGKTLTEAASGAFAKKDADAIAFRESLCRFVRVSPAT